MELLERAVIAAPPDRVWSLITDIPSLASCIPGATVTGGSDDRYECTIRARIGPVSIEVDGTVIVKETNVDERRAVMDVEGTVRRAGGGVKGTMSFELTEPEAGQTELLSVADLELMKTLAMLDNVLLQRKASAMFQEFARNLAARVTGNSP